MIMRLSWAALMVLVAALIAAVQLDREAGRNPALAELVPGPLRANAQLALTMQALESGEPAEALAEARRLVRRRPVPAEHLSLLAAAEARAGRGSEAAATIEQAARRGWREPLAQEAMLGLALDAGDGAEAARRYTALLLRQATPDAVLIALGPQVFGTGAAASPQASDAMAEIVAGGTRWHPLFLQRGSQIMPADAFASVANGAADRGARFDCAELAAAATTLARRDKAAARLLAGGAGKACDGAIPSR